jgi:hypothetical protein
MPAIWMGLMAVRAGVPAGRVKLTGAVELEVLDPDPPVKLTCISCCGGRAYGKQHCQSWDNDRLPQLQRPRADWQTPAFR